MQIEENWLEFYVVQELPEPLLKGPDYWLQIESAAYINYKSISKPVRLHFSTETLIFRCHLTDKNKSLKKKLTLEKEERFFMLFNNFLCIPVKLKLIESSNMTRFLVGSWVIPDGNEAGVRM